MKKALLAAVLLAISIHFLCLPHAHAGRPLTTDDAWTVEKGKIQLETGFEAARQDNQDWEYIPSLTLSYGFTERMDFGIGSGYTFLDPKEGEREKGFSDTEVKLKYRLIDEDEKGWVPAFAIAGKVKIPTASESKGLGSGKTDLSVNSIVTKSLNKQFALHLNLGYTFVGDSDLDNELNYSLAAQLSLTEKMGLVGEIIGVNNLNGRRGDDPFSWLLGTYYLITENVVWDAGIEIGLNSAAPDFRLTTGLTLFF